MKDKKFLKALTYIDVREQFHIQIFENLQKNKKRRVTSAFFDESNKVFYTICDGRAV